MPCQMSYFPEGIIRNQAKGEKMRDVHKKKDEKSQYRNMNLEPLRRLSSKEALILVESL